MCLVHSTKRSFLAQYTKSWKTSIYVAVLRETFPLDIVPPKKPILEVDCLISDVYETLVKTAMQSKIKVPQTKWKATEEKICRIEWLHSETESNYTRY